MSDIPKATQDAVARAVFEDMERLDWESLSMSDRTNQYARWIEQDSVGGRLKHFVAPDVARTWIKDGPVREWRSARVGLGRFASLVDSANTSVSRIVAAAVGPGWKPIDGSLTDRPLRVVLRSDDPDDVMMTWGGFRHLKNLVWAALVARANDDPHEWLLVVVGSFAQPVTSDERAFVARIARHTGLRIVVVDV